MSAAPNYSDPSSGAALARLAVPLSWVSRRMIPRGDSFRPVTLRPHLSMGLPFSARPNGPTIHQANQ